ncbi:hypothetical protein Hypma_016120 [Hypsizygus marmoreus]|uniref:Uncharacterized protein n=1 Tax=Hypsizygus marmoreus TaxID=39966 RepID=A0A369KDC4_HYPMA|nr:hypothetical protein Hypma_016120 [Hypsizygus marmoreus]
MNDNGRTSSSQWQQKPLTPKCLFLPCFDRYLTVLVLLLILATLQDEAPKSKVTNIPIHHKTADKGECTSSFPGKGGGGQQAGRHFPRAPLPLGPGLDPRISWFGLHTTTTIHECGRLSAR